MCHFAKIYSTEGVHQLTLMYAILGLFTENEIRLLIKFLINANQIKLKCSLLTSSFIRCCNKYVIIYSGASVSEFIRAIRPFISIDVLKQNPLNSQPFRSHKLVTVSLRHRSRLSSWDTDFVS